MIIKLGKAHYGQLKTANYSFLGLKLDLKWLCLFNLKNNSIQLVFRYHVDIEKKENVWIIDIIRIKMLCWLTPRRD